MIAFNDNRNRFPSSGLKAANHNHSQTKVSVFVSESYLCLGYGRFLEKIRLLATSHLRTQENGIEGSFSMSFVPIVDHILGSSCLAYSNIQPYPSCFIKMLAALVNALPLEFRKRHLSRRASGKLGVSLNRPFSVSSRRACFVAKVWIQPLARYFVILLAVVQLRLLSSHVFCQQRHDSSKQQHARQHCRGYKSLPKLHDRHRCGNMTQHQRQWEVNVNRREAGQHSFSPDLRTDDSFICADTLIRSISPKPIESHGRMKMKNQNQNQNKKAQTKHFLRQWTKTSFILVLDAYQLVSTASTTSRDNISRITEALR